MLFKSLIATAIAISSVLAGNTYMPSLPAAVQADLARRDPSEYETFQLRNDFDNINTLSKRSVPQNLLKAQFKCNTKDCMNITFDDGIWVNMRNITDTALNAGIKVTFFLNLFNYGCSYDEELSSQLVYAYKKGMEICNHSATHPHFSNLTHAEIDTEIELVETFLHRVIGAVPACFRLPYGDGNSSVVEYLNKRHGLVVINWNEFSGDANGESVEYSKKVYNAIKAPEQAIVLNHEPYNTTAHIVFPYAIKKLQENGYKKKNFQTVSQSLGFNPYKSISKPQKRKASWNCDAAQKARCATNPAPDLCNLDGSIIKKAK